MTTERLRELAERAAEGAWCVVGDEGEAIGAPYVKGDGNVVAMAPEWRMKASIERWPDNAAYIAAANPTAILSLLDELDALRGRLQAIIDWADFAMTQPEEFNSHGVRNLDGPAFDAARAALKGSDHDN